MEHFKDVHSVRLLGYKGRFLWADEDRRSVAQKQGQDSYGVIWRVELIPERNTIRLKSVYDLYLVASDYPFLLGATGKKVLQSFDSRGENVEWEPLSTGEFVKLRTKGDKFLRANGGMPPYRNSVTHDVPVLGSNLHVVLWEVDVVRMKAAPAAPPLKPKPVVPLPPRETRGSSSATDPEGSVPPPAPLYVPRPRPRRHSAPEEIEFPLPSASESSSPVSERRSPIESPASVLPSPRPAEEDDTFGSSRSGRGSQRSLRHRATVSEIPPQFSARDDDDDDDDEYFPSPSPRPQKGSNSISIDTSAPFYSPRVKSPSDFRRIYYTVAEDDGVLLAHEDDSFGSFLFKGHTLMELTEALMELTDAAGDWDR